MVRQFLNNLLFQGLEHFDDHSDPIITLHLILTIYSLCIQTPTAQTPLSVSSTILLVLLFLTIHTLTLIISTVPQIPLLRFICLVLACISELQIGYLLLAPHFQTSEAAKKEEPELGLNDSGDLEWMTPFKKKQFSRIEGTIYNPSEQNNKAIKLAPKPAEKLKSDAFDIYNSAYANNHFGWFNRSMNPIAIITAHKAAPLWDETKVAKRQNKPMTYDGYGLRYFDNRGLSLLPDPLVTPNYSTSGDRTEYIMKKNLTRAAFTQRYWPKYGFVTFLQPSSGYGYHLNLDPNQTSEDRQSRSGNWKAWGTWNSKRKE